MKVAKRKREHERQLLTEDIRILQGKILQLQRNLRMNGLLKAANEELGR